MARADVILKCIRGYFSSREGPPKASSHKWAFLQAKGNQLAIYKRGRGSKLETTEQIQHVGRVGLEPGTAELQAQNADHSATLPPPEASMRGARQNA